MKLTFKKVAICTAAILFTLSVKAQNQDYVITTKGDSIPCTIKIPLITCGDGNYKTTPNSHAIKIKPEDIKAYYISKKQTLYRAVIKEGKTKPDFLTVLETGKISLYEEVTEVYVNNSTTNVTKWFVAKGSDTVKQLKTEDLIISKSRKQRKMEFAALINDNQVVYDQYTAENKFSFKQIRNLVQQYNIGG
ncbi:nucleotidyltransferase [Mucilaginibacter sp. SP1R1]|uniref:nucleotidyltransferase n=1 Tax=Mucilaginibacter sp. SP1R1 TaxID=2723091 RepID=UPI00161D30A8|nr:nucleotidyltransferase [Mucilaginibacter sp. SP1R1]MBB6150569.1 CHAT domain-containing protein [Mucilaginibacter sp. SP1R1]